MIFLPGDIISLFKGEKIELNKDYKFCENAESEHVTVEILTGKFKSVLYKYNNVEVDKNGNCSNFDIDIVDDGIFKKEALKKDKDFEENISKILNNILSSSKIKNTKSE